MLVAPEISARGAKPSLPATRIVQPDRHRRATTPIRLIWPWARGALFPTLGFLAGPALRHRVGRLTLLSCDNLASNGRTLRGPVLAFGDELDAALAEWIARDAPSRIRWSIASCRRTTIRRVVTAEPWASTGRWKIVFAAGRARLGRPRRHASRMPSPTSCSSCAWSTAAIQPGLPGRDGGLGRRWTAPSASRRCAASSKP